MREIAAIWTSQPLDQLPIEPQWTMSNWGIGDGEYEEFHRFAVTEHRLFETMAPLAGSPEAIGRLSQEGVRIRIITHRLILSSLHEETVLQTVRWLDAMRIPYWDLCFMREKDDVNADLYVEDTTFNVERLSATGAQVLVFANATNRDLDQSFQRAESWAEAETMIRQRYYRWIDQHGLDRPAGEGQAPGWLVPGNAPRRSDLET
jgi:5'(3')-deoxyribonucleotidase